MAAIEKAAQAYQTYKKAKAAYALLSIPVVGIAIAILAVIALIFLIIFIIFYQMIIFGDEEKLTAPITSYYPDYALAGPVQYDVDGQAYFWPVPTISRVSSDYGIRNLGGMEFHDGIDIANGADKTANQPVYAMAAGTVTKAGPASGYGQAIYIDHGNGLVTKYGHLDANMFVSVGQQVEKGQRIALIGAGIVGRSTAPHLHFQVEENGSPVDPLTYVQPPGASVPIELSYTPLNINAVLAFLQERNSALADPSTLAMIDAAGKQTNVNPYLLIAITGQEQGFVPRNHNQASLIVKNPWNVFGCWCSGKGATLTTEQAAVIAAKTIVKLSQDRPPNRDPIQWLNSKDNPRGYYAEHSGWWIGVSKYFKILSNLGG